MARLKWNRAKLQHRQEMNRQERRLEAKADHMLLKSDPDLFPKVQDDEVSKRQAMKREHEFGGRFIRSSAPKEGAPERAYFRSIGSVIYRDGRWFALNGEGEVMGEHTARWLAWRQADQLGMERAVELG